MSATEKKVVTRTITIGDLSPEELARLFCEMDDRAQAAFFHAVYDESRDWPNSGWQGQACWIADKLTPEGKAVVRDLGAFFDEQEWQLPSTIGRAA